MFKIFRYYFVKTFVIPINTEYYKDPYYEKYTKKIKNNKINYILTTVKSFSHLLNIKIPSDQEVKTNLFLQINTQSIFEKKIYTNIIYICIHFLKKKLLLKLNNIFNFITLKIFKLINYKKFLYIDNLIKDNKHLYNKVYYQKKYENENKFYIQKYYFIIYLFKIYETIPKIKKIFLFSFKTKYNFENLYTIKAYYIPITYFKKYKTSRFNTLTNKYLQYVYSQSQRTDLEIINDKIMKAFYIRALLVLLLIIYIFFFCNKYIVYEKIWKLYLKEPLLNIFHDLNILPKLPNISNYLPYFITNNYITNFYPKLLVLKLAFTYLNLEHFFQSFYVIFEKEIINIEEIIHAYFIFNINNLYKKEQYLNFQNINFELLPIIPLKIVIISLITLIISFYFIKLLKLIDSYIDPLYHETQHQILLVIQYFFDLNWKIIRISILYIFGLVYPTYRDFKLYFLPNSIVFKNIKEIINFIIIPKLLFKSLIFKTYILKNYYLFIYKNIYISIFELIISTIFYINLIIISLYIIKTYQIFIDIYFFKNLIDTLKNINNNVSYDLFTIHNFCISNFIYSYIILSILEFKVFKIKNFKLWNFILFTITFWLIILIMFKYLEYLNLFLINFIISKIFLYPIFIKLFNFTFKQFASLKNFNLLYIMFNYNILIFFIFNIIFIIFFFILKLLNIPLFLLNIFLFYIILNNCLLLQIQIKLAIELNIYFQILNQQQLLNIKSLKVKHNINNNINNSKYIKFLTIFLIIHLYSIFNYFLNELINIIQLNF